MTSMFIKINGKEHQFKPKRNTLALHLICEGAYSPPDRFYAAREHMVYHLVRLLSRDNPDRVLDEWILPPNTGAYVSVADGDVFTVHRLVEQGIENRFSEE